MPTAKRKGVPGKCSLPKDYLHHPWLGHGAMMPFMGMPQAMSLGQLDLGRGGPLAITYPGSTAPSSAARSVKSALDQLFSGA